MNNQESTPVEQTGKTWSRPWSYRESFIIAAILVILGFMAEIIFQEKQVLMPARPANMIILFIIISCIVAVHTLFRNTSLVKWFSSVPCAVSAIVSYAVLVVLMGFIRQENEGQPQWLQQAGLTMIKNSWPFLFTEVYLFISLGLVVLKRAYPLTRKNAGFLLNHFGLFLTLIAVAMGAGDMQRLRISLFEQADFIDKGVKSGHEIYDLPFSLKLLDFSMETYNPKIMLSDSTGNLPEKQKGESLPVIEEGADYRLNNYSIEVLQIIEKAARTDTGYVPSNSAMAATAALVHVKNLQSGDSVTNWICSGSLMMLREYILLEKNLGLWLLSPEPKKFESRLVIRTKTDDMDTVTVEVNRPYKTAGWSFYQIGYEENLGPDSQLSIIEAVYDPWLKLVYAGVALMLAGAVYIFWQGRGVKSDE
jgi:hypothetical protein